MFCPECGSKIFKNVRFCKECGKPIDIEIVEGEVVADHQNERFEEPKFGKSLLSLVKVTNPIIIFFNFAGWIIAGIWLLALGQWEILLYSFIIGFISPFLLSIPLLLDLPLAVFSAKMFEAKKKSLGLAAGATSMAYTTVIETIWAFIVFSLALSVAESNELNVLPFLLLGYGITVSPIQYMASKEGEDAIASYFGAWYIAVAYIILIALYYLGLLSIAIPILVVISIMIITFLIKMSNHILKYES